MLLDYSPRLNGVLPGNQLAAIINASFELKAQSQAVDVEISDAARDRLDQRELSRVETAERAAWIVEETEKLQTEYTRVELEMRAAIEEAVAEAERRLSPQTASAQDLLAASSATPEQPIDAMDSVLGLGEAGEDGALLFFQVARQRDYEDMVAHAIMIRPDWEAIYEDVVEGSGEPDLEVGLRFEMFAAAPPSKQNILAQQSSDANIYGQFR